MNWFSASLGTATVATVVFGVALTNAQYLWPLKLPPQLSSGFADSRFDRWHAGIDIRTAQRTGFRVYASTDGYMARVRTSFWGYGKALYFRADDGNLLVYGHLEAFAPAIEEAVKKRQLETMAYAQLIDFDPNQFRFKRGELIAFSGQSGVGYPHLHLEVRDPSNRPLNPLKGFFGIKDVEPPVVTYLAAQRFIEYGRQNYRELEFLELEGSAPDYRVLDTLAVYGQTVLAVCGFDPGGEFKFGLNRARLLLDGQEIFAFCRDTIDYATNRQILLVNDMALQALVEDQVGGSTDSDRSVFYRLYVQKDDRQLFYGQYRFPAGIISGEMLDERPHLVEIEVGDAAGNISRVQLWLRKAILKSPAVKEAMIKSGSGWLVVDRLPVGWRWELQSRSRPIGAYKAVPARISSTGDSLFCHVSAFDYRLRVVSADGSFGDWLVVPPASRSFAYGWADRLELCIEPQDEVKINDKLIDFLQKESCAVGAGLRRMLVAWPQSAGLVLVESARHGQLFSGYLASSSGRITSPDSSITLTFSKAALPDPAVVFICAPTTSSNGAVFFEIGPSNVFFSEDATLEVNRLRLNIDTASTGIYAQSARSKNWVFKHAVASPITRISVGGTGRFAILKDEKPPAVTQLKPAPGSTLKTNRPLISCQISDDLSGFSREEQFAMHLDGQWVPAEFDITTGQYSYRPDQKLIAGPHKVEISVSDNQENRTKKTWTFFVSGVDR